MEHYIWYRIAHLLGMVLWLGGIAVTLANLGNANEIAANHKATFLAKARRQALAMDIGAALALVFGLVMAFTKARWGGQTAFTTGGWLHAKLGLVALGLLVPHGILRMRLARLRKDPSRELALPAWLAPVFLLASAAIIILIANPTLMRK